MKKRVSFWIATAVSIACCVAMHFFHHNRFLLEDGSILSFAIALVLLGIPFGVSAIIGVLFNAEFEGETSDIELWKVTLTITIILPIIGIYIVEDGHAQNWDIDPIWVVDAQFLLPMLVNYLFTLWAIFRDPKAHRRVSTPPIPSSPEPVSPPAERDDVNWDGLPDGIPHMDLSDM